MLRIYTSNSPAGVKAYFNTADYYTQGSETVGHWGGKLAAELGLFGQVTQDAFERLCDNLHPLTGDQLTPRHAEQRRVGDDFILSLPKDVGAAIMLAPNEVRQAMLATAGRRAHQVMEAIEADVQTRVRKNGAFHNRDTGTMVWASFLHTTARPVGKNPPDPHPHWHMFAFNATRDPEEGRIKAIELGNVYRDRPYYETLFFSLVAKDYADQGYAVERRADGRWGFAGLEPLAATFSKRTDEVEAEARRLNITDAAGKSELGAKTRAAKQKELTQGELQAAWFGQLSGDQSDALARFHHQEVAPGQAVTAHEAARYALDHLSEQRSVFAERELLREAMQFGMGQVSLEEIARELPRLGVIAGEIDGEGSRRFVTTEALRDEERYLIRRAAGGGNCCPVGVAEGLERGTLNDGQWQVVQGLLNSDSRVALVEGPAGAGKTTMLATYDHGVKRAGEHVAYLATTASAVKVLAKDGFEAHTVAHFLKDERMQAAAQGGRLVIDESSMLGHKQAVELFRVAEQKNVKLIFVGDPMQHGSVPRGSFLRVLKDHAGVKSHRLTQIMRQDDPVYRHAAELLSQGKTLDGFDTLDGKGWVHEIGDATDRYRTMAADYVQAVQQGETCLVVSPTHREAAEITAEIRTQLRAAGKLGGEETAFTQLVPTNASEAERGQATNYRSGDVLVFHQNCKGHTKSQRLVVGDPARVPLQHAARFSHYRPQEIHLAVGDRIRFTGSVKPLKGGRGYKNGDTHAVAEITPGGNIRLDDGKIIAGTAGLYRSAFCETSFGAQGQTVQKVLLGMAASSLPATNQEQMYVSASRAKTAVQLYTDDKAAVRAAIPQSSQKYAALDLVPLAAGRDWRRDDADRQRRQAIHQRSAAAQPATRMPPRPSLAVARAVAQAARAIEPAEQDVHRGR